MEESVRNDLFQGLSAGGQSTIYHHSGALFRTLVLQARGRIIRPLHAVQDITSYLKVGNQPFVMVLTI